MAIEQFPPVELADEHGLLAVGGDLEIESLLLAYRSGIFPWPLIDDTTLTWFAPPERALLFIDEFRASRSLEKDIKREKFEIRIDTNTAEVIRRCAAATNRKDQEGTWIIPRMIEAYIDFSATGHCHSIECYENDVLVGGLYGVAIGGMFAGESMFYTSPNASKRCLFFLVEHLRERGAPWIDCQQLTPMLAQFGAREISRDEFMELLAKEINRDVNLFA